jgi:integrase
MGTIIKRKKLDGTIAYRVQVRRKGAPMLSATFPTYKEAEEWETVTEAAIRTKHHFPYKAQPHTLAEAVERYLQTVLPHHPYETRDKYTRILRWWAQQLGDCDLADLTADSLLKRRAILEKRLAPATVNLYWFGLSSLLTQAWTEWRWLAAHPMRQVRRLREPRGRVRFLSDEERERLLDACKRSTNPHLYVIVRLALATGGRHTELLRLTWQDIDLKRGIMTFHDTKNHESRAVPITKDIVALLTQQHERYPLHVFPRRNGHAMTSFWDSWHAVRQQADLHNFRFHDLRHTFASYLAMSGANLLAIAELLGHKRLEMVKRYAHLSEAHTRSMVERMNQMIFGK